MILPRGLVFLSTLWIFASWIICIGIRQPVQPSIASYLPGIRLFFASIAVGLCVGWPMLRLSEPPTPAPIRQVIVDFIALMVLLHVVLWPLRLATNWTPSRMGLIDLSLFAWGSVIGAILAVSIASRSAFERVTTMLLILFIALMGPIAYFVCLRMNWATPALWLDGPILGVLRESLKGGVSPEASSWIVPLGIFIAGVVSWIMVAMLYWINSENVKKPSQNLG